MVFETLQSHGVHVRSRNSDVVANTLRSIDVRVHRRIVLPVDLLHHFCHCRIRDNVVLDEVVDEFGIAAA